MTTLNSAHIGTDIESVARFRAMGEALLHGAEARLFFPDEHAYCAARRDPYPHFAARWCAKEAVVKAAAPYVKLTVRQVEVVGGGKAPPQVRLHKPLPRGLALAFSLSLAHTREWAIATALCTLIAE